MNGSLVKSIVARKPLTSNRFFSYVCLKFKVMAAGFILFDDDRREALLPFTFTRPVSEIRMGILTITQKWERFLGSSPSFLTTGYLSKKYPLNPTGERFYLINGGVCPDKELVNAIMSLGAGEALVYENVLLAGVTEKLPVETPSLSDFIVRIPYPGEVLQVKHLWDIFRLNGEALNRDFDTLTLNRKSASISSSNRIINPSGIFIETGAKVECSTLNAESGPIYIASDAEIMEGALIRGPFSLGEHSTVKMGAKIYGPTTIGPHCKVGGEINNSVIFGYSNKAHDGFLGNSVVGEWCNIGADTNNSNLKNNYAEVKLWSYADKTFTGTGLQFCGLFMGDHSKCGINTMFNTGTVVGICANIYGSGFPRNFVPCFSWGGACGFKTHQLEKALETARLVMLRRNIELTQTDIDILTIVFELTRQYRNF